jgi:hypothetical protein
MSMSDETPHDPAAERVESGAEEEVGAIMARMRQEAAELTALRQVWAAPQMGNVAPDGREVEIWAIPLRVLHASRQEAFALLDMLEGCLAHLDASAEQHRIMNLGTMADEDEAQAERVRELLRKHGRPIEDNPAYGEAYHDPPGPWPERDAAEAAHAERFPSAPDAPWMRRDGR